MKIPPKGQPTGSTFTYDRLPPIIRPTFADKLKFPLDITQISASEVSLLHARYTEMFAFVNHELARCAVRILELETAMSLLQNRLFRERPSLNATERWRRDAIMAESPEMEKLEQKVLREQQERKMHEMYKENFERYLTALSRELSRKNFEYEMARDSSRYAKI